MPREATLEHLRSLYVQDADPWRHLSSAYEAEKYGQTLSAAGPGPFALGLEVGCGNGALTHRLASVCDRLIGVECIAAAAESARGRLTVFPHVQILQAVAPEGLPDMRPDLVVLSEVLYFLEPGEIARLADWIDRRTSPVARIVSVSWTGPTDEALDSTRAADLFRAALGRVSSRRTCPSYLIDTFGVG